MSKLDKMIEGYGSKFPGLDAVLSSEPDDKWLSSSKQPIPELSRYRKSVEFLNDITSPESIGILRFAEIKRYFFELADELSRYTGKFSGQKIIKSLSHDDREKISGLGTTSKDVYQAELIEKFTEHDTAAAGDFLKLKILKEMPHLEDAVDGIHFATTSEDVMSIVFGVTANKMVYGHIIPDIMDFCNLMISYVEEHEKDGPLVIPGLTHEQAAEPSTLGKKFMTTVNAIYYHIDSMKQGPKFIPFSGKMGGAIGNLTTHYAAYPDIDWESFAKAHVERWGLHYDGMTHQSVTYAVEAQHLTTIGNMLTHMIKFMDDFKKLSSSPGQLFYKVKRKGTKGSSIMPNKSNAWQTEGAVAMLKRARSSLFNYAEMLPGYPHEGNMERSYLMRALGNAVMPIFIALDRASQELQQYKPNLHKIKSFIDEYPGMSGSVLQTVMKRAGISDDAYRIVEGISINPDGTYADSSQFNSALEQKMEELKFDDSLRSEIRSYMDFRNMVSEADRLAKRSIVDIRNRTLLNHNHLQLILNKSDKS
jgi:adenylosuccinate lyase